MASKLYGTYIEDTRVDFYSWEDYAYLSLVYLQKNGVFPTFTTLSGSMRVHI